MLLRILFTFLCFMVSGLALGQDQAGLSIIPLESGFGMKSFAGSGRHLPIAQTTVYKVTHLKASGEGSFQHCVHASGPRVCVFEVSGVIDLTGDKSNGSDVVNITNPYLTVAGQTAPSPGILIKGKGIRIQAHDVLIQHIAVRVGDSPKGQNPESRDTIEIIGSTSDPSKRPYNVVLDHISASWGIDETLTVKDTASFVTISNSIISEGLGNSLHPKGMHSKGLMASGNFMTVKNNLIAHVNDRAPHETTPNAVHVNNVIYNSFQTGMRLNDIRTNAPYVQMQRKTSVVGNIRISGPDSPKNSASHALATIMANPEGSRFFFSGNSCEDFSSIAANCARIEGGGAPASLFVQEPPIWNEGLTVRSSGAALEYVLSSAGSRPAERDSVDSRVVSDVRNRQGRIPNCVGADPIAYPTGLARAESSKRVVRFKIDYCGAKPNRYVGHEIRISSKDGVEHVRTILAHDCSKPANITLDKDLDFVPEEGTPVSIMTNCAVNAGGFPQLVSNRRVLELPSHPTEIMPSGYTRLEEYLHSFYPGVEKSKDLQFGPTVPVADLIGETSEQKETTSPIDLTKLPFVFDLSNIDPNIVADAGGDQTGRDNDGSNGEWFVANATASKHKNGTIKNYYWFLGQKMLGQGSVKNLIMPVGINEVVLMVVDTRGKKGYDKVVFTVQAENRKPRAFARADRIAVTDSDLSGAEIVAVDGSVSTDIDGSIVGHSWYNSGTLLSNQAKANLNLPVGVHQLSLEVVDNEGARGRTTVIVDVRPGNQKPIANAGKDLVGMIEVGQKTGAVLLDGSASVDPENRMSAWTWWIGEKQISSGEKALVKLGEGVHNIKLVVRDNAGQTSEDSVRVQMGKSPVAVISGGSRIVANTGDLRLERVDFDGTQSFDPTGKGLRSFQWFLSGKQMGSGGKTSFILPRGVSTVVLKVTDRNGLSGETSVKVTVP